MNRACRYTLFASACILACACSSTTMPAAGPPYVELSVAKTDVVAGDSVKLTFTNISGGMLTYGNAFCGISLEGRRPLDSSWVTVMPASHVCTLEFRFFPAGRSDSITFKTAATLPANTYRFSMESPEPPDSRTDDMAYSPTFTIRAAGGEGAANQRLNALYR
jgi:hypothetical protein